MKSYKKILAVIALSGMCLATAVASDADVASKKSKKHTAKAEAAQPECAACDAIKQLKEQIAAQQAEIDQLKGAQPQPAGTTDAAAQAAAAAAQQQAAAAAAAAAEANAKAAAAQADVNSLKPEVSSATAAAANAEKKVGELENPAYIHYKGVRITPGGYAQFATIYDVHNANSDTAAAYGSFPLSGSANSKISEFRTSGRASRLSLKAEGTAKDMKFLGYWESDFLGTTTNASETQTSSYAPRLRLAFGSMQKGSWRITGGQNWTLLQTTRQGIDPLTEWLPMVIDNSYTPGFSYARLAEFRVTKALGTKTWLALAVDEPATVANTTCVNVTTATPATCTVGTILQGLGNTLITNSPTTSSYASGSTPSNNVAPDLVAKVAFQPGYGHFEVKAVSRFFRDRVYSPALNSLTATTNPIGHGTNNVTVGYGVGFGGIMPIIAKKLDFDIQALVGKGIGRYSEAGGPDVTLDSSGNLEPVRAAQIVAGFEGHPNPKLDLYVYGGNEYYAKTRYNFTQPAGSPGAGTKYVIGYGSNQLLDGGCSLEFPGTTSATSCQSSGQTRDLWAVQPGFWYRMYKGPAGTVQFGASYAYVYRRTWSGENATFVDGASKPLAIENRVLTAFRYYLP